MPHGLMPCRRPPSRFSSARSLGHGGEPRPRAATGGRHEAGPGRWRGCHRARGRADATRGDGSEGRDAGYLKESLAS
uniref:Uncharacterized protein n=1 Tax=Oryza meridionalis TaxID=40149 RepID=A0A0E0DCP9_9ORYZ